MIRFYPVLATVFILINACYDSPVCHPPNGSFSDGMGEQLVFRAADGNMLWLTQFGSQTDTQVCSFTIDCQQKPPTIDIKAPEVGPFGGKTLYGIVEWTSDTSFRLQMKSGLSDEVRPQAFDPKQTRQFFAK